MVIRMKRYEINVESRLGLRKLTGKVHKLLRADVKSPVSSVGQEKLVHVATPVIIYNHSQRETRNALLEAEQAKVRALMEFRRRPILRRG